MSFLSQALTEDIWNEYKDLSDSYGVSFKQCIFPGIRNPDGYVGVLASSHDSYVIYERLFDRIMQLMHPVSDGHQTDLSPGGLVIPAFTDQ